MRGIKMPEPVNAIYYSGSMVDVYTEQQMQAYAQAVRDEALEEAAKMVDNCHPKASHKGIASAIRTMKEQS